MQDYDEGIDFESALSEERPRLIRLCAWLTGNTEAAEDLAQEALLAAWKSKAQLTSVDKLRPWISAIARNVCLNWSRHHYREQAHSVISIDSGEASFEDEVPDDINLELELDRYELANLLDRALALLPFETGQMLIEHYIQESSHAEIAAQMNINPGTVAVRLQRGKLTLQRLFRKNFHAEALAFGLLRSESVQWEQTNIWCPWCGRSRLLGKYQKNKEFALRCPTCDPEPDMIMAGLDLTKPYHARLLGNTKTYKPAYARLLLTFAPLYRQAIEAHSAPCLACGQAVEILVEEEVRLRFPPNARKQIHLRCPICGWASNKSLTGLIFSLPQVQQFWREYPRLKTLPPQEIEVQGSSAFITRLQSVTDGAELTVISRPDSFDPLEIHSNVNQ
jgi:RNA polymerase sigma factor (sigma-70 family)